MGELTDKFDYISRPTSLAKDDPLANEKNRALVKLRDLLGNAKPSEELAKQLHIIDNLQPIKIKQHNGVELDYYVVKGSVGGVTSKTCLVDKATLEQKLIGLANINSLEEAKQY